MGLGWCFGVLSTDSTKGVRRLAPHIAVTGVASIAAFIAIRWLNGYGNLVERQGNTIQAWLAVSKYPPDLAFLL
jgi:hypothetical protein